MKRFLRSKLVLSLAAIIMIAAAVAIPLSSSINNSHAHAANATSNSTSVPFNSVDATFYNNPLDSGSVDFTTATHGVFAQTFPNINFNPPDSPNCAPQGVDTRPFTDVVQNADGSCTPIIAQSPDKTEQAGVNDLLMFETKFVATLNVPSAGQLTSTIHADDGWIFCMENETHPAAKPTPAPGNIMTNPVTVCPGLASLPEMGDNNIKSAPTTNTITMNLPTAGEYGVEIDYTECCQGQLTLNINNSFTPSQSQALIKDVSLSVAPTTPFYNVDMDVRLFSSNIACPAKLILTLGSKTSTVNDVCGGNPTAPSDKHILVPVFDPANPANNLTPNSSTIAQATVTDQNGQDKKSVTVSIPPAPIWIGVGDSYSSGHNQLKNERHCIRQLHPIQHCDLKENDPVFSWVTRAVSFFNFQLKVPTEWLMSVDLEARSGKTTSDILSEQVPVMETQLTSHHGSWNIVSMTGGANDIAFSDKLQMFYHDNFSNNLEPWSITDVTKCVDTQTLWKILQTHSASIESNLNLIVADAVLADQNVRIVDVDYPYVMDTSNVCSSDHNSPTGHLLHGSKSVVDDLDSLHSQITGSNIFHVDLRSVFGTSPLNDLQLDAFYGYPHPNDNGQFTIASTVINADLIP